MKNGAFTLNSKRISRIMCPFRFWKFFNADDINIEHEPRLSASTWDGCGLISREMVLRLSAGAEGQHLKELQTCRRFSVTVLHNAGQKKAMSML